MDSRKDLLFALIIVALGLAVILIAASWPEPLIHDTIGPRAFPYGIGALFVLGGGTVAFQRYRKMNAAGKYLVPSEGAEDEPGHPASGVRGIAIIALAFGYAAVFQPVGFLIATPVFLVAALLLLNERNWITIILSAAIYTGATYFVFGHVLGIRLPRGILTGIIP